MTLFSRLSALLLGGGLAALALTPAHADKIKHPIAVFSGLDKITGRILSFDAAIGETVQFGSLQVTPRVCFSRPPTEAPRTDGFAEIDEVEADKTLKRIFTGWMFADSPGLHGVEHPVYDIWLTDCKGDGPLIHEAPEVADVPADAGADADPNAANANNPAATNPATDPKAQGKKKKPKATVDTAPLGAPLDLGAGANPLPPAPPPLASSGGRNPVARRYYPTDAGPIPPANVGQ